MTRLAIVLALVIGTGAAPRASSPGAVIELDGILYAYEASQFEQPAGLLGPLYGHVPGRFQIGSCNPNDLPEGTEIYQVLGSDPLTVIGTKTPYLLYGSQRSPRAKLGRESLDIGGRVVDLQISPGGTRLLAIVRDPGILASIFLALAAAPVVQDRPIGDTYTLNIRLSNGMGFQRVYGVSTHLVGTPTSIVASPSFVQAIDAAVAARGARGPGTPGMVANARQ